MKQRRKLFLVLVLLLAIPLKISADEISNQCQPRVQLYVFSAGYMPGAPLIQLGHWQNTTMHSLKHRILTTVYLTAGSTVAEVPTQEFAHKFGKHLSLPFLMATDKFARLYKELYSTNLVVVPSIVLADNYGNALKIYAPGFWDTNIMESDIHQALCASKYTEENVGRNK